MRITRKMKRELKMLAEFIVLLLTAVIGGIFTGNYVAAANTDIVLSPSVYMQKMVYISPWLMIVAVIAVVFYRVKSENGESAGKIAEIISVYTFTVMGIIVSGFCGMYTMADFIKVAIAMLTGVLVIIVLAIIRLYDDGNTYRIYNRPSDENRVKGVLFVAYSIVVVLSAFIPLGPAPVVFIGLVWCAVSFRNKY